MKQQHAFPTVIVGNNALLQETLASILRSAILYSGVSNHHGPTICAPNQGASSTVSAFVKTGASHFKV
jgi:hypothetical protein